MRCLTFAAALLALAGCQKAAAPPAANDSAPVEEAASGKGVDRSHRGAAAPAAVFQDADGEETSLADFTGQPVLVNLWASWCAPCVKELPTLAALAGRGSIKVVAVSQDNGPHASVATFLDHAKAGTLDAYQDPDMKLSGALNAQILPTTMLYDAKGREVWRYTGEVDWTGPAAAKLLAEAGASAAR